MPEVRLPLAHRNVDRFWQVNGGALRTSMVENRRQRREQGGSWALLMVAASEIDTAEWGTFIGGLIISASAIPAFVRGRKASLLAKGSGPTTALMEDRMTAMDEHYRERIGQIEQTHAAQLNELEERIDFTERMLTKQREQIGPG